MAETQGHKRVKKLLQKVHDDGEALTAAAQTGNLHQVHAHGMPCSCMHLSLADSSVIILSRLALSPCVLHAHQIRQLVQPAAGLSTSSHPGGCAAQAINWRKSDARTPLHHAAEHGHAGRNQIHQNSSCAGGGMCGRVMRNAAGEYVMSRAWASNGILSNALC